METFSTSVPDFGAVIERTQLVRIFRSAGPLLTVVCAPAGYGKSVLAGQLARSQPFDFTHWLTLEGRVMAEGDLLTHLAATLESDCEYRETVSTPLPITRLAKADGLLRLRDRLSTWMGQSVCIVLDGLDAVTGLAGVQEIAHLVRDMTGPRSRVLITCRSVGATAAARPIDCWVVTHSDLRFSAEEACELWRDVHGVACDLELAEKLVQQCGGQAALLGLLVRHAASARGDLPWPHDLLWNVEYLMSGLEASAMRSLYAAALLREGRVRDIATLLPDPIDDWTALAEHLPLLTLTNDEVAADVRFRLHATACDAICAIASRRIEHEELLTIRASVLAYLRSRHDYSRLLSLLLGHCTAEETASWCEQAGGAMLRALGPSPMQACLEVIPPGIIAGSPKLLLLSASVLRQRDLLAEAADRASIARKLAALAEDWPLMVDSSLMLARLALDIGDIGRMRDALVSLESAPEPLSTQSECLLHAYIAVAEACMGQTDASSQRIARVRVLLRRMDPAQEEAVFAVNCIAGIQGKCLGLWSDAAKTIGAIVSLPTLAPVQRLQLQANLAAAQVEMGRIASAQHTIKHAVREIERAGLSILLGCAMGTLACVQSALAEEGAVETQAAAEELLAKSNDFLGFATALAFGALIRRAHGRLQDSLEVAERSVAVMEAHGAADSPDCMLANLEIAGSLLALGDLAAAIERAHAVRDAVRGTGAAYHALRADLVLAEAARRQGDSDAAVSFVAAHRSYILSESSNWQLAMYIRTFPPLLSILATAVGAEDLPVHLLHMLPEDILRSSAAAPAQSSCAESLSRLRERLGISADQGAADSPRSSTLAAPCRVRLFGGLQVTTEFGVVEEEAWHKRKARALFAMLAVKQGQDVPRDVILERLWPDMEESRARNNFYVIWSAMKRALACGSDAAHGARYVQNRGGLCRITRLVRSDLDEFEEAISTLRAADAVQDDATLLAAARSLMEIYRGELLPGDVYDDWFGEIRDRTRQDFCDAMMRAAYRAETRGEFDHALVFLRRANLADPWREDVYQATMRCQIGAGRRSSAVETYLACRAKLIDDLGLDPSAETTRLYEMVLAMEEAGTRQAAASSSGSYAV